LKKKLLDETVNTLPEREQFIIRNRYLSENPMTLEDLGTHFGISRERVRQIEAKAFEKVRNLMHIAAQKLILD
jgi:RNA polymerase sigma-32 factor